MEYSRHFRMACFPQGVWCLVDDAAAGEPGADVPGRQKGYNGTMNLVTIDSVTKQYSERVLLENVHLLINSGDRIGLVGRNGSGKSTLLRLIAGLESPNSGRLTVWGGVRWRYVGQSAETELDPTLTTLEAIFSSDSPQMQRLRAYETALRRLHAQPDDPARQQTFADLSAEMDSQQGWEAETRAKIILTQLDLTDFDALVGTLSGGQQKRLALAAGLLDPADLLILDEPTNHIDADTIAWLEEYLLNIPRALLMVTHDRYFLDRVANRIVELDRRELISYPGNYTAFLELRERRQQQLTTQEEKRRILLKRELEWLRRGVKARGTKQKFRKQRVAELQQIRYDLREEQLVVALAGRRLGKKVLAAHNLSKRFGNLTLFEKLDFELQPGDRIGVIGPNGAGKTTFLNILAGKLPPDSGQVVWGETVQVGYYDQHGADLSTQTDMTALAFIERDAPIIMSDAGERIEAAQMLEWFLFNRAEQRTLLRSLSGGERRRLYLLHVLSRQPNVLFLDEPTNDLDIETLQVLEQFLDRFTGCLIVVSHDRYFLDRNVDFLMSLEDGVLGVRYPTPYASYRAQIAVNQPTERTPAPPSSLEKSPEAPAETARRLSWKETRELESLEAEIVDLEAQQARLQAGVNAAGGDYVRLQALSAELEALTATLDARLTRWLALSERV